MAVRRPVAGVRERERLKVLTGLRGQLLTMAAAAGQLGAAHVVRDLAALDGEIAALREALGQSAAR